MPGWLIFIVLAAVFLVPASILWASRHTKPTPWLDVVAKAETPVEQRISTLMSEEWDETHNSIMRSIDILGERAMAGSRLRAKITRERIGLLRFFATTAERDAPALARTADFYRNIEQLREFADALESHLPPKQK